MRRRTAAAVLAISCAGWLLSQVRPLPQDQGLLLEVSGRPVDALGWLQGQWQHTWRDCRNVRRLAEGSPAWDEARHSLARYSPPASLGARPLQLLAWGGDAAPWLLAEVVWDPPARPGLGAPAPLDPAIVPLARQHGSWQVQAAGVWSGDTGPWFAPVFIRRYLAQRLPDLPADLLHCLDPLRVGQRP